MAWWGPRATLTAAAPPTAPPPALTAAATLVAKDRRGRLKLPARGPRQDLAWMMYDLLGEIHYAASYMGTSTARARLRPGYRLDDDRVVPLDDPEVTGLDDEGKQDPDREPLLTEQAVEAISDEWARFRDHNGEINPVLDATGRNLFVAGECYYLVVGEHAAQPATMDRPERPAEPEHVRCLSVQQLKQADTTGGLGAEWEDDRGDWWPVTENDLLFRVYQAHPKRSSLPDSPVLGVLEDCETRVLLKRSSRSPLRSRLAGSGMLLLDSQLTETFGGVGLTSQQRLEAFVRDLMETLLEPLQNDGSPADALPYILSAPSAGRNVKDLVTHVSFERMLDPALQGMAEDNLNAIVRGLDLPPEIILGQGGMNHWSSWIVSAEAYNAHVAPKLQLITSAIAAGFLRPMLRARRDIGGGKQNPALVAALPDDVLSRVTVMFDGSDLIRDDEAEKTSQALHDRLAISDSRLRRDHGYDDEDAPDDEEYERRVSARRGAPAAGPPGAPTGDPSREGRFTPKRGNGAPERPTMNATDVPAVAASAGTGDLGRRLGAVDQQLRLRLHAILDAHTRRTLERAGNRAGNVLRKTPEGRAQVDAARAKTGNDPIRLVATVGLPVVTAAISLDDLLHVDVQQVREQVRNAVRTAHQEVRRLLRSGRSVPAEVVGAHRTLAERAAEDAAELAVRLLDRLLPGLLDDPSPNPPPVGEIDPPSVLVPSGLVRAVTAVAGGAPLGAVTDAPEVEPGVPDLDVLALVDGPVTEGPGVGSVSGTLLDGAGLGVTGYTWEHGIAERTFPPHVALDGRTFTGRRDPALLNPDTFPRRSHYWPGDHKGCSCSAIPTIVPEALARPEGTQARRDRREALAEAYRTVSTPEQYDALREASYDPLVPVP